MRLPFNDDFVKWAIGAVGGIDKLKDVFQDEVRQRHPKLPLKEALQAESARAASTSSGRDRLRGLFDRAFVKIPAELGIQERRKRELTQLRQISKICRILSLSFDIKPSFSPWDKILEGQEIHILLGYRSVDIPEVSRSVRQRAVGLRDSEALKDLMELLYQDVRISGKITLHHADNHTDAVRMLELLRQSKKVGLVIALGSAVVNPFSDPLAKMMLADGGSGYDPPAKFRFSFDHPGDWFLAERPERNGMKWGAAEEGIMLIHDRQSTLFRRIHDDLIWDDDAKDLMGTTVPTSKYKDAGMLLIDARKLPILVLCAGHGGCGTIGAVKSLGEFENIADLLEYSEDLIGLKDRVFAIIDVDRKINPNIKDTDGPKTDDLVVDRVRIAWPELGLE